MLHVAVGTAEAVTLYQWTDDEQSESSQFLLALSQPPSQISIRETEWSASTWLQLVENCGASWQALDIDVTPNGSVRTIDLIPSFRFSHLQQHCPRLKTLQLRACDLHRIVDVDTLPLSITNFEATWYTESTKFWSPIQKMLHKREGPVHLSFPCVQDWRTPEAEIPGRMGDFAQEFSAVLRMSLEPPIRQITMEPPVPLAYWFMKYSDVLPKYIMNGFVENGIKPAMDRIKIMARNSKSGGPNDA